MEIGLRWLWASHPLLSCFWLHHIQLVSHYIKVEFHWTWSAAAEWRIWAVTHGEVGSQRKAFVLQGCISLQGSRVSELPANQDKLGGHLFEIVSGKLAWWQDQVCLQGWKKNTNLLLEGAVGNFASWVESRRKLGWLPLPPPHICHHSPSHHRSLYALTSQLSMLYQ